MKSIVCLKEVVDSNLSLDFGLVNKVVFREGLPHRLNPNDAAAMAMALDLNTPSAGVQAEITVISVGPARTESYLRQGLSLGATKAIRIWDEAFGELSSFQKAKLITGAIKRTGADLIFMGAGSMDTGNCQVAPLTAAWLDMPCVNDVVRLDIAEEQDSIYLIRDIGRGERERIQCSLPTVITIKGEAKLPYASVDRLVQSKYSDITVLSPADLDIYPAELKNDPTMITGLSHPRPRPRKVPTPESSLPAFYRILKLLEGGISRRRGLMLEGSSEELADQLFKILLEEGVIKSAR